MANDNWNFAVGCLVIKDDKVLLVRHTYGSAKGKLLIPGGHCNIGEMPEAAAKRECKEETDITANVTSLLAIRFNTETWYPVFLMKYQSGVPASDGSENSEAIFMSIDEAINNQEITDLTKRCLIMYRNNRKEALKQHTDYSKRKGSDYSLYGTEI